MLLVITVPLALLLLDVLSIGTYRTLYKFFWGPRNKAAPATTSFVRLLVLTGLCQTCFVFLVLVADLLTRLSMPQNEGALHFLLLSAFFFPPLLLWRKHRQLSTH